MKNDLSLDILTSVLNGEEFIPNYLASIRKLIQEGNNLGININVFIVDAGSTDETIKLLECGQVGAKIFIHPNISLPAARNLGISHSNSEFILLLDIDDVVNARRLLKVLKRFSILDYYDFYFAPVSYFGPQSKIFLIVSRLIKLFDGLIKKPDIWFRNYFVTPGSVLLKRRVFEKIIFDPSVRIGEDWVFFIELQENFRGRRFPWPFLNYYLGSNSASSLGAVNEKEKQLLNVKIQSLIRQYRPFEIEKISKRFKIYEANFELSKSLHKYTLSELLTVLKTHIKDFGFREYGLRNILKVVVKFMLIRKVGKTK